MIKFNKRAALLASATGLLFTCSNAYAQESVQEAIFDTIIVTGTKKAGGEDIQDVPISITAFSEEKLNALNVRDINDLAYNIPNVMLDGAGTVKGVANFSVRGLGTISSIPSIDPTVGVFSDGIYLGITAGVIFDTFDLESIEVLRGPQGVLFGRNVTGGAVLINTKDPSQEFSANIKTAVDSGFRGTGLNYYAMGSISGPLIEDRLAAKLAVYYNDDKGWQKRYLGGPANGQPDAFENHGKSQTSIIRPAITFTPSDNVEIKLKLERGEQDGDGPSFQSHTSGTGVPGAYGNFSRESFDFSINEPGFVNAEWNQIVSEVNIDVPLGDGVVTNITGWREFDQSTKLDADASPRSLFDVLIGMEQSQISNELRYSGNFGQLGVTSGVFYFQQDLDYTEGRNLLGGALTQSGGGIQDQDILGIFSSFDYQFSNRLTANAGLRYTRETKDVQIASLAANTNAPCSVIEGTCPFDFTDSLETSNWSPKFGVNYEVSDVFRIYGGWSRAFRAGGYNFRNSSPTAAPGPISDERVDTFEVGFKSEPGNRAILNGSVFVTNINDGQRVSSVFNSTGGTSQLIRNTSDAEIMGFELEGTVALSEFLVVNGSIGYLDGEYKEILLDISGDNVVDNTDFALDIPRLSPLTASVGATVEKEVSGLGFLTGRINYSHRDRMPYSDNNLTWSNPADLVDASLSIGFADGRSRLTFYGRNLTNDVQFSSETNLPAQLGPAPLGGTFAPLDKGRQIGLEFEYKFD